MKPRPKRFYRNTNPMIAQQIRQLYFSRAMKRQEIADKFGLRQGTVSRIVSGATWSAA